MQIGLGLVHGDNDRDLGSGLIHKIKEVKG